jgi:hypothetical protein
MRVEGRTFTNETVDIDFNIFVRCHFDKCTLIYHGSGVVGLEGCSFSQVNWTLADGAANTIKFLTGLYHGAGEGGRNLVERTFDDIRRLPKKTT